MKKSLFLTFLFAMLAMSVSAQYRYASGAIVGSMYGGTYKMYCSDHIVMQQDLSINLHRAPGAMYQDTYFYDKLTARVWSLSYNPSLMYQAPIADVKVGWLNWFAGMGISGGIAFPYNSNTLMGIVGANAIAGIEYAFEGLPLAFSVDFRPGYSCMLRKISYTMANIHAFDWAFGVALRYYVQ